MRHTLSAAVAAAKRTFNEIRKDDLPGMASQAAYSLVFALPPLLIFFAALSAVVARYTGVDVFARLLSMARYALPSSVFETLQLVLDGVRKRGGTGLLSIGFVLAIWGASGAIAVLMKAFNRAYNLTETRGWFTRRLIAIGLTIGLSILIIVAFVGMVFGSRLGAWLAGKAGLGQTFAAVWGVARWPVVVGCFMLALAILYWAGPAARRRFRLVSIGAVVATLLWLGATFGFSLYLRVSDPGSAYGALGALVVLLFFLYVTSLILLLGAEIDAALDRRFASCPAQPTIATMESDRAGQGQAPAEAPRTNREPAGGRVPTLRWHGGEPGLMVRLLAPVRAMRSGVHRWRHSSGA